MSREQQIYRLLVVIVITLISLSAYILVVLPQELPKKMQAEIAKQLHEEEVKEEWAKINFFLDFIVTDQITTIYYKNVPVSRYTFHPAKTDTIYYQIYDINNNRISGVDTVTQGYDARWTKEEL